MAGKPAQKCSISIHVHTTKIPFLCSVALYSCQTSSGCLPCLEIASGLTGGSSNSLQLVTTVSGIKSCRGHTMVYITKDQTFPKTDQSFASNDKEQSHISNCLKWNRNLKEY